MTHTEVMDIYMEQNDGSSNEAQTLYTELEVTLMVRSHTIEKHTESTKLAAVMIKDQSEN